MASNAKYLLFFMTTFFTGTLHAQLPLGMATAQAFNSCPRSSGSIKGSCWSVTVSGCAEVTPLNPTATVKLISPKGTAKGTITFATGYGSGSAYESSFTYGSMIVNGVVSAGYQAVELIFDGGNYGWMSVPSADGPRTSSCQYGTVTKWVYEKLRSGRSRTPLCATGNSGGSGAVAYMLAHYGFGTNKSSVFYSMVEETSGPPMGRLDIGCLGTYPSVFTQACGVVGTQTYTANQAALFDSSYGNRDCSHHVQSDADLWYDDSVDSPDATYSYPSTDVHVLFGGKDTSVAAPFGQDWAYQIITKCTIGCVQDAGHNLPDSLDAAQQILGDLTSYCKLQ
jgi:hypothetical protein